MAKLKIISSQLMDIMISRLSHQLIENHGSFEDSALLGLQPKGVFLAEKVKARLKELCGKELQLGYLDTTFHRDDFRRRAAPIKANSTNVPFVLEDKKVVLVDDVLYTGRSVRAAVDAMLAFGRPSKVELLVMIDRKYSRDLPVEASYTGRAVNSIQSQRVIVEWKEQGFEEDNIWLVNQE